MSGEPTYDSRRVKRGPPVGVGRADYFDRLLGHYTEYGRDVANGRWTYLISADGPQAVDQLKLSFNYVDVLDPESPATDQQTFANRQQAVVARVTALGKATVAANLSPVDAAQRSQLLRDVRQQSDHTAVLVLKAPAGQQFDGQQVWDVMLCLGLEWGDMDCFHWRNHTRVGDDSFFSVETTTPPGYFLPEEIAANRVYVDDLVFLFSVPRCASPVEVFDAMQRAVAYCRTRIGGTIEDAEGRTADLDASRQSVVDTVRQLREAGFEPGVDAALRLF